MQILLAQCYNLQKIYVYTNLKFTFRLLFQQLGCFCQVWQKILYKLLHVNSNFLKTHYQCLN
jgi:hypothetical protein